MWGRIMDALAAAHDAAVRMIDTSVVRVHQHAATRYYKLAADYLAFIQLASRRTRTAAVALVEGEERRRSGADELLHARWRYVVDHDRALNAAREAGHAPTLMFALGMTTFTQICCRNSARGTVQIDECVALAEEKGIAIWQMLTMAHRGCVLALVGKSAEAIQTISSGIDGWRSIGATVFAQFWLSHLALAHANLGKFDEAWRCISEAIIAMETTKERWWEPEVHRTAGEITLMSPQQGAVKAQWYYDLALRVARQQQAKSLELRAAMSLARLWRDQGKVQQARELLAPVYGWFTEGFDTRDLREAKALLEELGS